MHSLVNKGSYKPFIKWAGGKSRSVNKLLSLFPKNIDTYVEPFVGSGALYFKVNFKRAIINDLNFELICAYRQVRDNLEHLKSLLRTFKYDREMFLEVRAWDRSDDFKDKEELYHAARLIYLIKTCYNAPAPSTKSSTWASKCAASAPSIRRKSRSRPGTSSRAAPPK